MSHANLSARELRLLTAYLDGELPPGQAARVAQRVAADPAWQEAYAAMLAVKQGLRDLPRHRAPRAFTLPAAAATRQRIGGLQRAYRWASAAALLLLLFVFAGDFLTHHMLLSAAPPPPQALSAAPAPAERPAAESAKAAEGAATPTAPPQPRAFALPREENALQATPTPTIPPTPMTATAPLPPPAAPTPWGWRLAEGMLACLAVALAYLGWRRR